MCRRNRLNCLYSSLLISSLSFFVFFSDIINQVLRSLPIDRLLSDQSKIYYRLISVYFWYLVITALLDKLLSSYTQYKIVLINICAEKTISGNLEKS